MRTFIHAHRLVVASACVASALAAAACVSGGDDDDDLDTTDHELRAADEAPHAIGQAQLDARGEVVTEALPCGLSVLQLDDHASYWIRNCAEHGIHGQVITLNDEELYADEEHAVAAHRTVSGSVRGRVLRLRRR